MAWEKRKDVGMGKGKKLSRVLKMKITKMFKKGCDIREIKEAIIVDYPKITPDRIRTVIRKHLKGECNKLWSLAVKVLAGRRCAVCGQSHCRLESHHLIGRDNKKYCWDVNNGICLCSEHHTLGRKISAHGSTDVTQRFSDFLQTNLNWKWEWLQKHINDHEKAKMDTSDLLAKMQELKKIIEEAENGCNGESFTERE